MKKDNRYNFIYITSDIIKKFISIKDIIDTVEKVYKAHGMSEAYLSDPPGMFLKNKEQNASFKIKGASIPSMKVAGFRLLGFTPKEKGIGEDMTYGYSYLVDPDTAAPLALINESYQYILRTGATAAVNMSHLGKRDSQTLGVIGTGRIGRAATEFIQHIFPLKTIKIYDFFEKSSESFVEEMEDCLKANIDIKKSPEQVVRESDLIVTATSADDSIIQPEWLKRGATICSLGQGQETDHRILEVVNKLVVDNFDFCTMLGDINAWISKGFLKKSEIKQRIYGTISEIIIGKKAGRENQDEIILTIPQGMSSSDLAIAHMIYEKYKDEPEVQKITINGAN